MASALRASSKASSLAVRLSEQQGEIAEAGRQIGVLRPEMRLPNPNRPAKQWFGLGMSICLSQEPGKIVEGLCHVRMTVPVFLVPDSKCSP